EASQKTLRTLLLTVGKPLEDAKAFQQHFLLAGKDTDSSIQTFIATSIEAEKNRQFKRKAWFTFVFTFISFIAVLAWWQRGIALEQEQIAIEEKNKVTEVLKQTSSSLSFMNFELRDVLTSYVPTDTRVKVMEQVDKLIKILQQYGDKNASDIHLEATSLMQKADVLLLNSTVDPEPALQLYQQAHQLFKILASKHPQDTGFQRDLSASHARLGDIYLRLGETDKALTASQAMLAIAEHLSALDSQSTDFQRDLSASHARLGDIYLRLGETDKAFTASQATLAIAKHLSALDPQNTDFQQNLSASHARLGDIYLHLGETDKALTAYQAM
ncbi:MAG: tetratricopeptide repeat protein, partial [Bacteroidetes bacterium]|nr:tetratricopeptide repeat protein [Bacteroidota bacterium]